MYTDAKFLKSYIEARLPKIRIKIKTKMKNTTIFIKLFQRIYIFTI